MSEVEELKKLLIEEFDIDISGESPDTDIGALGVSSFDLAQIAVAVEEKYGKTISDKELYSIKTVGDIIRVLTAKKGEK